MIPLDKITGESESELAQKYNRTIPLSKIIGGSKKRKAEEKPEEDKNFFDYLKGALDFTGPGIFANLTTGSLPHYIGGLAAETAGNALNTLGDPNRNLMANYSPDLASGLRTAGNTLQNIADNAYETGRGQLSVDDFNSYGGSAQNAFKHGGYGVYQGIARMLHSDKAADSLNQVLKDLDDKEAIEPELSWEYITSPHGWIRDIFDAGGSMAALLPAMGIMPESAGGGIAAALGGDALTQFLINRGLYGAAKQFAKVAPNAVRYGLTSPWVEGFSEGGNTRESAIGQGLSEDAATKRSIYSWLANVPVLTASNTLEGLLLGGIGKVGATPFEKVLNGIVASQINSAQQAAEEFTQGAIQNWALDKPYSLNPFDAPENQISAAKRGYAGSLPLAIGSAVHSAIKPQDENEKAYENGSPEVMSVKDYGARYNKQNRQNQYSNLRNWVDKNTGGAMNDEVFNSIVRNSQAYGVPTKLALAMAMAESNGNQDEISPVGAIGVMQLMPETAESLGVDPYDTEQNIRGGIKYLAEKLADNNGDWNRALAAYNAGQGNVDKYGGIPPYKETQDYVSRINGFLDESPYYDRDTDSRAVVDKGIAYLGENGKTEGKYWVRQKDSVSFEGGHQHLKDVADILGRFFYERTGKRLVVTSAVEGEHDSNGTPHGHDAGWKLDVNDVGGGDVGLDEDGPLTTRNGEKGWFADEFIAFGRSLGLGMNFEYGADKAHIDVSLNGNQWNGEFGNENAGGFSLDRIRNKAREYNHTRNQPPQSNIEQESQEEPPRSELPKPPQFDINDDNDSTTQKLIAKFARDRYEQAIEDEDAYTVESLHDKFKTNGEFINTPENRKAVREKFGDDSITEWANNQNTVQTTNPETQQSSPEAKVKQGNNQDRTNSILRAGEDLVDKLVKDGEKADAIGLRNAIQKGDISTVENVLRENGIAVPQEQPQPQEQHNTTSRQDPVNNNKPPENVLGGQDKATQKLINVAKKTVATSKTKEAKAKREAQGFALSQLAQLNGIQIDNGDITKLIQGDPTTLTKVQKRLKQAGVFEGKPIKNAESTDLIDRTTGTTILNPDDNTKNFVNKRNKAYDIIQRGKEEHTKNVLREREADEDTEEDDATKKYRITKKVKPLLQSPNVNTRTPQSGGIRANSNMLVRSSSVNQTSDSINSRVSSTLSSLQDSKNKAREQRKAKGIELSNKLQSPQYSHLNQLLRSNAFINRLENGDERAIKIAQRDIDAADAEQQRTVENDAKEERLKAGQAILDELKLDKNREALDRVLNTPGLKIGLEKGSMKAIQEARRIMLEEENKLKADMDKRKAEGQKVIEEWNLDPNNKARMEAVNESEAQELRELDAEYERADDEAAKRRLEEEQKEKEERHQKNNADRAKERVGTLLGVESKNENVQQGIDDALSTISDDEGSRVKQGKALSNLLNSPIVKYSLKDSSLATTLKPLLEAGDKDAIIKAQDALSKITANPKPTQESVKVIAQKAIKELDTLAPPSKYPDLSRKLHSIIDTQAKAIDVSDNTPDSLKRFNDYVASVVQGIKNADSTNYEQGNKLAENETNSHIANRQTDQSIQTAQKEVSDAIINETTGKSSVGNQDKKDNKSATQEDKSNKEQTREDTTNKTKEKESNSEVSNQKQSKEITDEQINEAAKNPDTANALEQLGAKVEDGKVTFPDTETRDAVENFIETQIAWHGSPYIFDEFLLNSIGNGEGAQSHGWGLYFAAGRDTAEKYRQNLTPQSVKIKGKTARLGHKNGHVAWLYDDGREVSRAEEIACFALFENHSDLQTSIKSIREFTLKKEPQDAQTAIKLLQDGEIKTGSLFKVEIPDSALMLDEQKTLSKQPPKVKAAVNEIATQRGITIKDNTKGKEIYQAIAKTFEAEWKKFDADVIKMNPSDMAASQLLNEHGVKGITYNGGKDKRCYVVFDDKAIKILEKFSLRGSGNTDIKNFVNPKDLTLAQRLLSEIAQKLGVRAVFFRNENKNFHGAFAKGITFFNVNSEMPLGKVFWHESLHWLKANNAELYQRLVKAVGITKEQRQAYLEETGRKDLETREEIDEEILADQFFDAAKRTGLLQSIAGKNRGLIERVVQWLKDTMNKFIEHFRNPQGKLTTAQAKAFADEFGKVCNNLVDENGEKIFRYNRRTGNIETIEGRKIEDVPFDEETLKEIVSQAEREGTLKYSIGASNNSSESLIQKARNYLSSLLNETPNKSRDANIADLLHRITGYKIDFGNIKDGDKTIIDDIHKFIRTKHAYEWEKLLPQIGGKIAKTLKLNPTQEMSNYIADWCITGAIGNTSDEAKAFEKAMANDPFTQSLMLQIREAFQDFHDMSSQDKIGSTLVSRLKGKSWKEIGKIIWQGKEEQITDDLHPILRQLNEMVAKAEKTDPKLAKMLKENIDVYKKMRLLRGVGGLGKIMVEGDAKHIDKIRSMLSELYPRLNFDKLVTLNMIVDMAGGAEHFEGLMKFAVAKLDKEIHEKARANPNKNYRPQFSEAVDDDTIQQGEKQYSAAHKALVTYSHILATIQWDAGLITDAQYSTCIKAWDNYIPMRRVFDENDNDNDTIKFADSLKPKTGSKRKTYDIWESLTQNTLDTFSRAERNRAKQQLAFYARVGEFGDIIQPVETSSPNLNIIHYREHGEMKYLKVFDPAVARAVENIYHPADTSWLMKALTATCSFMRAMYTTANAGFAFGNIPRDMQDAYIHARHVDANPFIALLEAFRTVKNNFSPKRMWKEKSLFAEDDDWIEFNAVGGTQSTFVAEDIDQLKHAMNKIRKKNWVDVIKESKGLGKVQAVIEAIQAFSEQTEYFTRMNTYKRTKAELVKQHGGKATLKDMQLAALEARDASTDFAKSGTSTRSFNKLVLFANAQVQDLAKWGVVGRDLAKGGEAREQAKRKIFRTIVWGAVAQMAQTAFLTLCSSGDDDWLEKYRKRPAWEKETYWFLGGIGDTGFRIPKGQDLMTRLMSACVDEWFSNDPVSAKRIIKVLGDAVPSIIPTLIQPYMEARDNYAPFRDAPIVPTGELTRVEWEQYGMETSGFAKWLGSKIGNTFINEYFISASPRKIDHVIKGYFGTLGSTVSRLPDMFTRGWSLNDAPIISRFAFDASRNSKVVKEYYEELNKQAKLARAYESSRRYDKQAKKPDGYNPKAHARLESIATALRKLSKKELEIFKNPKIDLDKKNEQLRKIEKQREKLCEKALKKAREFGGDTHG